MGRGFHRPADPGTVRQIGLEQLDYVSVLETVTESVCLWSPTSKDIIHKYSGALLTETTCVRESIRISLSSMSGDQPSTPSSC